MAWSQLLCSGEGQFGFFIYFRLTPGPRLTAARSYIPVPSPQPLPTRVFKEFYYATTDFFSLFFLSVFRFCMFFFFVFSFLLQFLDFGKNAVVVNMRRDGHHWAHAVPHAGSGTMWGQGDRSTRPPRARHFMSMYREVPPVPPLLPCPEPRASPGQREIHSPVLSQGPSLSAWERRGGSLPLSLCTPESQSHA